MKFLNLFISKPPLLYHPISDKFFKLETSQHYLISKYLYIHIHYVHINPLYMMVYVDIDFQTQYPIKIYKKLSGGGALEIQYICQISAYKFTILVITIQQSNNPNRLIFSIESDIFIICCWILISYKMYQLLVLLDPNQIKKNQCDKILLYKLCCCEWFFVLLSILVIIKHDK